MYDFFHMVSIDVPAGVGASPLNTTSTVSYSVYKKYRLKFASLLEIMYFRDMGKNNAKNC